MNGPFFRKLILTIVGLKMYNSIKWKMNLHHAEKIKLFQFGDKNKIVNGNNPKC